MTLRISLGERRPAATTAATWYFALLVVALLASGCGDDESSAAAPAPVDGISISDSWARPSPGGGGNTALYMTINNNGSTPDTLLSASAEACGTTEIHMTSMEDGVMSMTPLADGIAVTSNASIVLGPGGLHLMCIDVGPELVEGETTNVTLEFAEAGSVSVVADIRNDE